MSATIVVARNTVKVWDSLADAQALAEAGKGGQLHYFQFDKNSPKRKYYVDENGWMLVANGSLSTGGSYSQAASAPVNPDDTQTIITAQEAAAIPDLGRVQISSADRTGVHLESSNPTVLERFQNYNPLTYQVGEESLWTDTGTSTSQLSTVQTSTPSAANSPLSFFIYHAGADSTAGTMQWLPLANIEGQPRYNPQLWVHAPIILPPTPLRAFRFNPLGAVDFSNKDGGSFNTETDLGNEPRPILGTLASNLPNPHTYTITVNVKEDKPFRLVYGGQSNPRENKGIVFYCQDGKTRVSSGTNTSSNNISNWDATNLNGWYETNFEMGDCGQDLDLTVTVENGVVSGSYEGNTFSIPITQTSYNNKILFNYDLNGQTDALVRVVVRESDEEVTDQLNVTELEKNATTSGIELPIDTNNELAEVYSAGTEITDQPGAVTSVTIAEQTEYNLFYAQKPTTEQQVQVSTRTLNEIQSQRIALCRSHSWSYTSLGRPLYESEISYIRIPFPSSATDTVNLHIVLGTSYFRTDRSYATFQDLGVHKVIKGGVLSFFSSRFPNKITPEFIYTLWVCNDGDTDVFDSAGRYMEFTPEQRIFDNPPWTNNYADVDGSTGNGIGAEIFIKY